MFKLALRVMSGGPEKTLQKKRTNHQCLGGVLFIISVKVKFSLDP